MNTLVLCICIRMSYEYTKYVTTVDNLRATIEKYGVAILPNVLDDTECSSLVSGIWDYFEHMTQSWSIPISRNNPASWKEIYKFYPKHSMLFQHYSVGHAQVCWDFRQNKTCANIFASLWQCKPEDLLTSFDGLSFNVPPEVTKRGWNQNHTWYHTDQSYSRNSFESVQSWVTGLDVHDGDATLAFLEGSNKLHKNFADHFKITDKSDWYKLNETEEQWYVDQGCTPKKIMCPKGSLVFWDSRTIHCGVEADKHRHEQNMRAVVYLCYVPRSLCTKANLAKKVKAFEELRTTNHYPHKPKVFAKTPRTYGGPPVPDVTPIEPPVLTELGRRLAGY